MRLSPPIEHALSDYYLWLAGTVTKTHKLDFSKVVNITHRGMGKGAFYGSSTSRFMA